MVELGKLFMGENCINLELSNIVEDYLTKEQQEKVDELWNEMAGIIEFALIKYADNVKEDSDDK